MLKAQLAAAQYGGARTQRRRAARSRLCATTASSAPPGLRILVTGSTKGLGRALVDAFLSSSEGVRVCVNSRSQAAVAETVSQLQAKHGQARVCGFAADVALPAAVDALAQYAVSELGGVDCWINNAGSNGTRNARVLRARVGAHAVSCCDERMPSTACLTQCLLARRVHVRAHR
jgi:NADP-dependent 3-hydroxy acid dehydrogenase YdfG